MSGQKEFVRYSEAFKNRIVEEIEKGKYSVAQAQKVYDIGCKTTIYKWMRAMGKNKLIKKRIRVETPDELNRIKKLEKEIAELKDALVGQTIKALAYEKMIELAEKELGIKIKKNSGTE